MNHQTIQESLHYLNKARQAGEVTTREAAAVLRVPHCRVARWVGRRLLRVRVVPIKGYGGRVALFQMEDARALYERLEVCPFAKNGRNNAIQDNPYKIDNRRPAYAKDVERTVRLLTMQRTQYCVMSDTDPAAERAERQRSAALALTPVDRYRREWRAMQRRAS